MKRNLVVGLLILALLAGTATVWYVILLPPMLPVQPDNFAPAAETAAVAETTADSQLADLLKEYPHRKSDAGYLIILSDEFLKRQQIKKAARYLDEILVFQPRHPEALSRLAKVALFQKDISTAKSHVNSLPDDNDSVIFTKALIAVFEEKRDEAGRYLHMIISRNPDTTLAASAQRLIDAYREFDYYRDGKPIHLRTLLARAFNQINEPALSIWFLRDVLTEKTDYRDAWILLGYAYFQMTQYPSALDAFRKAYELDSEKPETQYFLGLTHFAQGNRLEAQRFLEYALLNGFEPRLQVYEKLSQLYLENGLYEKAAKAYESFIALLPARTPEHFLRPIGIYIEKLSMPEKALALAQQVAEAHPGDATALSMLAWTQLATGQLDEAEKNLNAAEQLDPSLALARLNFGRLHEARGDREKAKASYKEAYEMAQGTLAGNDAAKAYNALVQQ